MVGRTANSSSPEFYWKECIVFLNDSTTIVGFSTGIVIFFAMNIFEMIVGLPLNIWLFCHILDRRSKTAGILPADFFSFHVTITYFIFYVQLPVTITNYFLWHSNLVMNMMVFLESMVTVVKPLLLCLACVERYIAVVRPLDYTRLKNPKVKWACLAVIWCIYFIMASLGSQFYKNYALCSMFIPILIIDTLCTGSILKSLRKPPPGDNYMMGKTKKLKEKRTPQKEGEQRAKARQGVSTSKKKKAFKTVMFIQTMFFLSYTPYILMLVLDIILPAHILKCELIGFALAMINGFSYVHPLLYMHKLRWLRCTRTHRSASIK